MVKIIVQTNPRTQTKQRGVFNKKSKLLNSDVWSFLHMKQILSKLNASQFAVNSGH